MDSTYRTLRDPAREQRGSPPQRQDGRGLHCCRSVRLWREGRRRKVQLPHALPGNERAHQEVRRRGGAATNIKSAKDLPINPEHHNRTKHVERRHFFIRDMVEKFELRVPLVSTVNNYADFFTKPLKSKVFFGLRNKIMNIA